MLAGCVVGDEIDDDANALFAGGVQEIQEVVQRSENRIDGIIVADVVAVIGKGGPEEGREPDTVDAQIVQIRHALLETYEVADPVAISVRKSAHVDSIDDRAREPRRLFHRPLP